MTSRAVTLWLAFGLGLASCGTEEVVVRVHFPSEEAFLLSERARLRVVSVPDGAFGQCPPLLSDPADPGDLVLRDSGVVDACELRAAGVGFAAWPGGATAILVEAFRGNQRVLVGCREVPAGPSPADEVDVQVFFTTAYDNALAAAEAAGGLPCATVRERCEGTCGE